MNTVYALLMCAIACFAVQSASGQIVAEDADGESSIVVSRGIALNLNLANASVELSAASSDDPDYAELYYSGFVSVRAVNSLGSLLEYGEFEPGVKAGGYLGYYFPSATGTDVWLVGKFEYGVEQYDVFRPDAQFDEQLTEKQFSVLSGGLHLNGFFPDAQLQAGIAVGVEHANNVASLEEVSVGRVYTVVDSLTGRARLVTDEDNETDAWQGEYKEFGTAFFNAAVVKELIDKKLALTLFVHEKTIRVENYDVGLGINILKGDDPTNPSDFIGSITLEFPDLTEKNFVEKRFWKKMKVNLTTSLPISL